MEPSAAITVQHDSLPDAAALRAEIERCGWAVVPGERRWAIQTPQGPRIASVQICRSESRGADAPAELALVSLPDWTAPEPGELFRCILDVSLTTRLALDAARRLLGVRWLLLASDGLVELFRLPSEACELRATSAWDMSREFLPALSALARRQDAGPVGVSAVPMGAAARQHGGADALGGWLRQWTAQLATQLEATPAAVERMLWKWIVMLQIARRADHAYDREQWGIGMERLGDVWEISYDALGAATQLRGNLERFDQIFATRLFDGETAQQCQWVERLDQTHLLEQLRAELLMQCQHRFDAESVAWLFTDLEREQAGWRREITGAEPMARRLMHEGWNVFEPLTSDVAAYGLGAALRDADRLAQYWQDLDAYLGRRTPGENDAVWSQPDLFCRAPRGVDDCGRLQDGLNFLFGESMRLVGVAPEARFGVGVVFLLKAIAFNRSFGWPLQGLDTLDRLLRGR